MTHSFTNRHAVETSMWNQDDAPVDRLLIPTRIEELGNSEAIKKQETGNN